MSASHPNSPRIRKHTKTFTGCWTCRARKIRCDEAKPQCTQCRRKKTECEGYSVRLHWVRNDTNDDEFPACFAARSNIVPDSKRVVLPTGRLNQILHQLDSLSSDGVISAAEATSNFIDCFGVFSQSKSNNHSQSPNPSVSSEATPVSSAFIVDTGSPLLLDEATQTTPSEFLLDLDDGQRLSLWPPSTHSSLILGQNDPSQLTSADISENLQGLPNAYSHAVLLETVDQEDDNEQGDIVSLDFSTTSRSYPPAPLFLIRPTPSHLSDDENFLLYHYSHRVLYLFCVIDHEKSPWKTIHLPKALQATGELSVRGSTTKIRKALISALLAVSSFLLSNDNQSQLQADEALTWRAVANKYRFKAIRLLRIAVENDLFATPRPKYKEYLATTLSMVTMNVISGDTDTCDIHLDGCFRLISSAQKWKLKYSPRAESLHQIYFYLRVIYESTTPQIGKKSRHRFPFVCDEASTNAPDIFHRDLLGAENGTGTILDLEARTTSCERIYGIPHGLLFLLTEIIYLTDKLSDRNEADLRSQAGDTLLEDESDQLEKAIMDWPLLVGFDDCTKADESASAQIVRLHTFAFHNALIIYFGQNIRRVSHRFLHPYTKSVLESMEKIESLKDGTQVLAAPLYWPAFIAASETFDIALQHRFRTWYSRIQVYRIESMRTGFDVLEEVWKAGPSHRPGKACRWREVVERTGLRLMLS